MAHVSTIYFATLLVCIIRRSSSRLASAVSRITAPLNSPWASFRECLGPSRLGQAAPMWRCQGPCRSGTAPQALRLAQLLALLASNSLASSDLSGCKRVGQTLAAWSSLPEPIHLWIEVSSVESQQ